MKNKIFNKLFFYSKRIFLYSDAKITVSDVASLKNKKEKGEKKELDVKDLVDRTNNYLSFNGRILSDLPVEFSTKLRGFIKNHFLRSADRFDRDAEKGLDKYEFDKFKVHMVHSVRAIVTRHVPSKEEMAAAKRTGERMAAANRRLQESMNIKSLDLNDKNLLKKGRLQQEMFKIGKATEQVNDQAGDIMQKAGEYSSVLASWNGLSANARNAQRGRKISVGVYKTQVIKAKNKAMPAIKKKQKEIETHIKKLQATGKLMKKSLLKTRGEVYEKLKGNIGKKRNEAAYNALNKAKKNFTVESGFTPEFAVKKIDHLIANPFKYGISPQGMRTLLAQRAQISKLKGRPAQPSGFDSELYGLRGKVGRTLEIEQLKQGNVKELIAAKFAPAIDAVDDLNGAIDDQLFSVQANNTQVIYQAETSIKNSLSKKIKGVGGWGRTLYARTIDAGSTAAAWTMNKALWPAQKMWGASDYLKKHGGVAGKGLGLALDIIGAGTYAAGAFFGGIVALPFAIPAMANGIGNWVSGSNKADNAAKFAANAGKFIVGYSEFKKGNYIRGTAVAIANVFTMLFGGSALVSKMGAAGKVAGKGIIRVVKIPGRGIQFVRGVASKGKGGALKGALKGAPATARRAMAARGKTASAPKRAMPKAPLKPTSAVSATVKAPVGKVPLKARVAQIAIAAKETVKTTTSKVATKPVPKPVPGAMTARGVETLARKANAIKGIFRKRVTGKETGVVARKLYSDIVKIVGKNAKGMNGLTPHQVVAKAFPHLAKAWKVAPKTVVAKTGAIVKSTLKAQPLKVRGARVPTKIPALKTAVTSAPKVAAEAATVAAFGWPKFLGSIAKIPKRIRQRISGKVHFKRFQKKVDQLYRARTAAGKAITLDKAIALVKGKHPKLAAKSQKYFDGLKAAKSKLMVSKAEQAAKITGKEVGAEGAFAFNKLVKQLQKNHPKMKYSQAKTLVQNARPKLYAAAKAMVQFQKLANKLKIKGTEQGIAAVNRVRGLRDVLMKEMGLSKQAAKQAIKSRYPQMFKSAVAKDVELATRVVSHTKFSTMAAKRAAKEAAAKNPGLWARLKAHTGPKLSKMSGNAARAEFNNVIRGIRGIKSKPNLQKAHSIAREQFPALWLKANNGIKAGSEIMVAGVKGGPKIPCKVISVGPGKMVVEYTAAARKVMGDIVGKAKRFEVTRSRVLGMNKAPLATRAAVSAVTKLAKYSARVVRKGKMGAALEAAKNQATSGLKAAETTGRLGKVTAVIVTAAKWPVGKMGNFGRALKSLPQAVRNSMPSRRAFIKFETQMSKLIDGGMTHTQALARATKNSPGLAAKSKQYVLGVERGIAKMRAKELGVTGAERGPATIAAYQKLTAKFTRPEILKYFPKLERYRALYMETGLARMPGLLSRGKSYLKGKALTRAVKKYDGLGFKKGSSITVRRSSGKIEGGWQVQGRLGDRIIVTNGKLTKGVPISRVLKRNPKGPLSASAVVKGTPKLVPATARRAPAAKPTGRQADKAIIDNVGKQRGSYDKVNFKAKGGKALEEFNHLVDRLRGRYGKVLSPKSPLTRAQAVVKIKSAYPEFAQRALRAKAKFDALVSKYKQQGFKDGAPAIVRRSNGVKESGWTIGLRLDDMVVCVNKVKGISRRVPLRQFLALNKRRAASVKGASKAPKQNVKSGPKSKAGGNTTASGTITPKAKPAPKRMSRAERAASRAARSKEFVFGSKSSITLVRDYLYSMTEALKGGKNVIFKMSDKSRTAMLGQGGEWAQIVRSLDKLQKQYPKQITYKL